MLLRKNTTPGLCALAMDIFNTAPSVATVSSLYLQSGFMVTVGVEGRKLTYFAWEQRFREDHFSKHLKAL